MLFALCSLLFAPYIEASSSVNKQFTYYIYWLGIRGGKAVLDYKSTPESTIIQTRVTSAAFISLFYKVDDFAQTVLYPDGYPEKFTLKIREGPYRRHKITDFKPRVPGSPQKVIFNNIRDDDVTVFELKERAYDPLSAFYAITKTDIKTGESSFINIFDNEKLWNTEVQILRKEKIRVKAGEFDTIVIKPLIKSEGIFIKTGEIYIWLTDDDQRIPVKLTSKAIIGKFTVMLAEGDIN
jgi:hypothetical protein